MKYEILAISHDGHWADDCIGDNNVFDTQLEAQEFMLYMASQDTEVWGKCTWKVGEVDGSQNLGGTWTGPFKNFSACDLSDEQRKEFLRQWDQNGYYMDDTESPAPWCCPWLADRDIRGNTIRQMVENYLSDYEDEIDALIAEDEAEAAEAAEAE